VPLLRAEVLHCGEVETVPLLCACLGHLRLSLGTGAHSGRPELKHRKCTPARHARAPLHSPAPPGTPPGHSPLALQINAEKSPFLTDKLKIWMLPTLALIKHEKVEDYVVGFTVGAGFLLEGGLVGLSLRAPPTHSTRMARFSWAPRPQCCMHAAPAHQARPTPATRQLPSAAALPSNPSLLRSRPAATFPQELGNDDEFDTSLLEQRLAKSDIIDYEWPAQRPKSMAAPSGIRKGGAGFQKTGSDEDSDLD